jgi:hypothetical protein
MGKMDRTGGTDVAKSQTGGNKDGGPGTEDGQGKGKRDEASYEKAGSGETLLFSGEADCRF